MLQDFQQASVARDVILELVRECDALVRAQGESACVNRLSQEAVAYFVRAGEVEEVVRQHLQDYIANRPNPVVLLRQIVAEQRTMDRLNLSAAVHAELASSE